MNKELQQEMDKNLFLLNKMISCKKQFCLTKTKKDKSLYDSSFMECLNNFSYLVDLQTNRYKKYSNYKDLRQEGMIGLINALNKFNPERSKNFFMIANWYIKIKIKRSANKFDVVSPPIVKAKISPVKRVELDFDFSSGFDINEEIDQFQLMDNIKLAIDCLSNIQKKVICLYYGINENTLSFDNTMIPLTFVAKKCNLTLNKVQEILNTSYNKIYQNVKGEN